MAETLVLSNNNLIYEAYNLKEKVYNTGLVKLKKYSFDTIKGFSKKNTHNGTSTEEQLEMYLKKRVKERKEKIIDIAFSNSWQFFLTLTFDPKNKKYFPNGYSHEEAINNLRKWLDNQKHKNKNMRYIIVSEFHKESGNLHFHGLFSKVNWSFTEAWDSKKNCPMVKNGCKIYNLNDYNLGFTTISEIQDSTKVSIYLSKYITKDLISLKNKKVFWYSRNLDKPKIDFKYINCDLKEYLKSDNIIYYNKFIKLNSSLEVADLKK